jgi:hypothetical protein
MDRQMTRVAGAVLVAVLFAGASLLPTLHAQSAPPSNAPATTLPAASAPPSTPPPATPRPHPNHVAKRAELYYGLVWGVESISAKSVESGEIIRVSYHVVDAAKAKTLNDKNLEPALIDVARGVKLVVPAMENVGSLRQTSAPEAGRSYWLAFSNSGRIVKVGDHVDLVIGDFHADGLIVQ